MSSIIILSICDWGIFIFSTHFIKFCFLMVDILILYACCCRYFIHFLLFLIFFFSVLFLVCVIFPILYFFVFLLQKNSADLNLFCGVPIFVALDLIIYSSPEHKSSIVFFLD